MSGLTKIINPRAIVSGVHAGKTNKEISDFKKIPVSMVKKQKKDYIYFIHAGNSPDTYDIPRKIHKGRSNVQDHDIVERVQ